MQKGMLLNLSNIELGTVNNAVIQIGDIDDTGKGRHFKSKFIQAGLVKIEGHGIVLLKKETIDQSLQSMVGAPVIIKHQDVTNENADELRCGVISKAYFNDFDGWYYCEGIIWDEKAKELVNNGWSVSCSYDYLAYNDEGGVENNIHYDKEFTQLNFTHLAIVDNPRYERANIVFNSKDEEKGKWVTINGNHIFIPDGKTLDEVIKEKGWGDKEEGKSEPKKESNTTKDTRKHIDRIEKLIKKYNLEPHEEDELLDELGSFEAKLDENLEPREEEELREELFDFEDDIKRHQEMKKQEKSEPEWLQREKQKLDRQTTQMYEDRYSVEHPKTYKKNLEEAKDKQNPDDELVTVQKADTHKLEVRLNDLKSRYNEVMKYYWEADEDDRDIHQYKADAIQDEMIRIQDRLDELKGSKEDRDADKFREQRAKEREKKFKNDKVKAFLNKEYDEGNIVADRNKMKKLANFLGVDFWDLDDDRIQDIFEYSGEDYQYFENHTDEENRDYDIERTADKLKKYAEELNQNKEGARQNLLKQDLKSMLKKISPSADYRYDADEKELQVRYLGKWEGDDGSGDYDWQTPTQDTRDKIEEIKKEFKKRFGYELKSSWGEKNWYSFWIPDNKTNNSKEQDMKILYELKKLISKVENEKGEQDMDEKEKVDNENVDKRKLIDEVAGIMKSAGCDDEDIRTAIGKMEKIGYDKSEAGSADNKKVKNEEPDKKEDKKEDKEIDNEDAEDKKEAEDLKEDAKEDVKNKCKNSKSSFDKINEIYNSVKQIEKETGYVSRQQKLDNAVEYFK